MPDYLLYLDSHAIASLAYDHDAEDMLDEVGAEVATVARGYAPKNTGAGAESITHVVSRDSQSALVDISWDAEHFYMGYAETGTSTEAAQPFLRPALDQTQL